MRIKLSTIVIEDARVGFDKMSQRQRQFVPHAGLHVNIFQDLVAVGAAHLVVNPRDVRNVRRVFNFSLQLVIVEGQLVQLPPVITKKQNGSSQPRQINERMKYPGSFMFKRKNKTKSEPKALFGSMYMQIK